MKISVLQEQFAEALTVVIKAIDARASLPVLANVLLRTVDARLEVVGTDLGTSIVSAIGAKIDRPGAITLPAKTLLELVKNFPEERIDLTLDDATQTLNFKVGGKTQANLKGIRADEYPPVPTHDTWDVTLPAKVFGAMIKATVFCVADTDSRPILTGLYMHLSPGCLQLAAADGYRLAVVDHDVDNIQDKTLVVPGKPITNFGALLTGDGDVQIGFDDGKIHLSYGHTVYSILLLEGKFPDFGALIPRSHETQATLYTTDLLKATKRAEIFARDSNYSSRLAFKAATVATAPSELTVTGKSAERGDLEGVLDIELDGSPLDIAFNIRYLIDVLSHVETERVVIESNGASHPGLIYPEGSSTRWIIMPMAINR